MRRAIKKLASNEKVDRIEKDHDRRLAQLETTSREAPTEYANRDDFNRETVLTRRRLDTIAEYIAEQKGASTAAMEISNHVAHAIEKLGDTHDTR